VDRLSSLRVGIVMGGEASLWNYDRPFIPKQSRVTPTRAPLRKRDSEKMGEVLQNHLPPVASGSGRNTGGGSIKGKEIFSENIPDFEEQSKPNPNLKKLTLNMENGFVGRDKGDGGLLHLSLIYI
jgi:hypothetical protein